MSLDSRTALTQIETALQSQIWYRHGYAGTYATTTAIRAIASATVIHGTLAHVGAASPWSFWRFDRFSSAVASATVLVPTDNPAKGRWIKFGNSRTWNGYLKAVELFEGQATTQEILTRYAGRRPCVVIVWDGSENRAQSLYPGALYDYRPSFQLWVLSSNLRPEHQTAVGSAVTAEATADPGTNAIIGDLRNLIAGNTLGDLAGVKWCEIGSENRVFTSLADRVMIYQLRCTVLATIHMVDEAPYDEAPFALDDPGGLQVQVQLQKQDGTYEDYGPVDSIPQP